MRRDPTRHADSRALLESLSDLTDSAGDIETLSERVHFLPKQLLQLLSADRQKIVFFHDSESGVRSCRSSGVAEGVSKTEASDHEGEISSPILKLLNSCNS
jgi:hypothetical protein